MKTKRILLICALVAAILIAVFMVTRASGTDQNKIDIDGIADCSDDIDPGVIDGIEIELYEYVSAANSYNENKDLPSYDASVRSGSCKLLGEDRRKDFAGNEATIYSSIIVVDIRDARQSWRIKYDWVTQGKADDVDLGSIDPTCVDTKELMYGDFSCEKILNIHNYGTPEFDPIMQYVPYEGEGFDLKYNPGNRQITMNIIIPVKQKGNQALIDNTKEVMPYWFKKRNLDPNSYGIVYTVTYE